MIKFVPIKSDAGSKFSKTSLGLLCTWRIVVVHIYYSFSLRRRCYSRAANSEPHFWSIVLLLWGRI